MTEKNHIEVGLVQINNSFSGQNYLPYSVALLQEYVKRHALRSDRYEFRLPIYKRIPIGQAVDSLLGVNVVGFSTYVWNAQISLHIARRLKERAPETFIIFGGPHVPDNAQDLLLENPFIDVAVHGEGEQAFLKILEALPSRNFRDVSRISYFSDQGDFIHNAAAERIKNLADIPSPFLNGTLDAVVSANPDETWIGLWETNRGCPFSCSFCDWGSATASKMTKFDLDTLKDEVRWFSRNKIEYIFCCDANFGIQKRDVEIAEFVAKTKNENGYPHALSVQNTKNATERAYLTQKILSDSQLNKGVALSMQSVDAETLSNVGRKNIALETYMELQRRFTRDGIETYSDLILGLPGETYDTFADGIELLMDSGQHNRIQFNNLSVLPNAEMGSPEYQAQHGMELVETDIINIHGKRVEMEDDVQEIQQLVIATNSMPRADWRRARALSWMSAFLHFNKILQIPLIVTHELAGIGYRPLIESFLYVEADTFPLVSEISALFMKYAGEIQNGGPEYILSEPWLGIYWPADEYVLIKLVNDHKLDAFYGEAERILCGLASEHSASFDLTPIKEAIKLNRCLIKEPFANGNITIEMSYDLLPFYQGILRGHNYPLSNTPSIIEIDREHKIWDDFQNWCLEVVWWGNKKGAYLYGAHPIQTQLAGHF